jgi:hypothetical protein
MIKHDSRLEHVTSPNTRNSHQKSYENSKLIRFGHDSHCVGHRLQCLPPSGRTPAQLPAAQIVIGDPAEGAELPGAILHAYALGHPLWSRE